MAGVNASLLAVAAALAVCGTGWLAIHIVKTGFFYSGSGGNPRNRGQAYESLWDIGKGAFLIYGASALAAWAAANLKFA
jgi:hypothetical protein